MTLLTVRQAAQRLGVGYSTLKQWIYQGRVRTRVTGGGHHRIPEGEVDRLLAPSPATAVKAPVAERTGAIVSISGRNQLRGYVDEVRTEGLLAQVRLRIGDQTLTAVITRDAVEELKLRRGDEALAIVKSTEVMIAREGAVPAAPATASRARRRRRPDQSRTRR
jgi:molybdopterin-binding protein